MTFIKHICQEAWNIQANTLQGLIKLTPPPPIFSPSPSPLLNGCSLNTTVNMRHLDKIGIILSLFWTGVLCIFILEQVAVICTLRMNNANHSVICRGWGSVKNIHSLREWSFNTGGESWKFGQWYAKVIVQWWLKNILAAVKINKYPLSMEIKWSVPKLHPPTQLPVLFSLVGFAADSFP